MNTLPHKCDPINITIITNEEFPDISLYNIVTEALLYVYYVLCINDVSKKDYLIENTDTYEKIHIGYKNHIYTLSYTLRSVIFNTIRKKKIIILPFSKELIEMLVCLFRMDINAYKEILKQFKLQLKINHKKFLGGWKTKLLANTIEKIDTDFTQIQDNINFLEANNTNIES